MELKVLLAFASGTILAFSAVTLSDGFGYSLAAVFFFHVLLFVSGFLAGREFFEGWRNRTIPALASGSPAPNKLFESVFEMFGSVANGALSQRKKPSVAVRRAAADEAEAEELSEAEDEKGSEAGEASMEELATGL